MKKFFAIAALMFGFAAHAQTKEIGAKKELVLGPVERISYDFGPVPTGFSGRMRLTLKNNQTAPYSIVRRQVSGADFSSTTNCPKEIQPGKTCRISVYFQPWFVGISTGRLDVVLSNGRQTIVDMKGTGTYYQSPHDPFPPHPPIPPIPNPIPRPR